MALKQNKYNPTKKKIIFHTHTHFQGVSKVKTHRKVSKVRTHTPRGFQSKKTRTLVFGGFPG
jgi:hypothetical protein